EVVRLRGVLPGDGHTGIGLLERGDETGEELAEVGLEVLGREADLALQAGGAVDLGVVEVLLGHLALDARGAGTAGARGAALVPRAAAEAAACEAGREHGAGEPGGECPARDGRCHERPPCRAPSHLCGRGPLERNYFEFASADRDRGTLANSF